MNPLGITEADVGPSATERQADEFANALASVGVTAEMWKTAKQKTRTLLLTAWFTYEGDFAEELKRQGLL